MSSTTLALATDKDGRPSSSVMVIVELLSDRLALTGLDRAIVKVSFVSSIASSIIATIMV